MAGFILDTHVLLWWLEDSPRLSSTTRNLLIDPSNVLLLSVASLWEMQLKQASGKLQLPPGVAAGLSAPDFEWLPITIQHVEKLPQLPLLHADPFDRIMIAQAQVLDFDLLTADAKILQYGTNIRPA